MATKFIKIAFGDERGEFERVAKDFSGESVVALKQNTKSLMGMYSKSSLSDLTESIWKKLENTDSFRIKNVEDIKKAISGNIASSGSRNIDNVMKEFMSGSVRAPIILCYNSNKNLVEISFYDVYYLNF